MPNTNLRQRASFTYAARRFIMSRLFALREKPVGKLKRKDSDIFIMSYPKSGTTWMQMLLFQLTTKGNLDEIKHMLDFSPHWEEDGEKLYHRAEPRVIKTHIPHHMFPKGKGKIIYVMRDGLDVARSYYHHHLTFQRGVGEFADFYQKFLQGDVAYGSWFDHLSGWLRERDNPQVLFIQYEDMISDFAGVVEQVIDFCQFDRASIDMARVTERCSFDYMKTHERKFDLKTYWEPDAEDNEDSFFRNGNQKPAKILPQPLIEQYQQQFAQQLQGLGVDHYAHGTGKQTEKANTEG